MLVIIVSDLSSNCHAHLRNRAAWRNVSAQMPAAPSQCRRGDLIRSPLHPSRAATRGRRPPTGCLEQNKKPSIGQQGKAFTWVSGKGGGVDEVNVRSSSDSECRHHRGRCEVDQGSPIPGHPPPHPHVLDLATRRAVNRSTREDHADGEETGKQSSRG